MNQRPRLVACTAAGLAVLSGTPAGHAQMDMDTASDGTLANGARDPHAYSDGVDFTRGNERPTFADQHRFRSLLVDHLEVSRDDGHTVVPFDLEGWFGKTYDRAILKAEGEYESGHRADARTELLWGHAILPYWDSELGVRYDNGPGPDRAWLAAGIEGLAPYRFDLEVTAYVGESNRTALRLDASYDLRITQRLILEPRIEANWYGRIDSERGLGTGLADASMALRLRHEIRRELAPYVGVEWSDQYGGTEARTRAGGGDPSNTRFTMGLHFWF